MTKVKKENSSFVSEKYDKLDDMGLDSVLDEVRKKFGTTSIMKAGDRPSFKGAVIPTDSLLLNKALLIQGLPGGRIIEIFGGEGSGKTTLALGVVANAQKAGGDVAFLDAEHALSMDLCRSVGVDTDRLVFSQPDSAEQGLEMLQMLVASNKFAAIVVDSVAALTPQAEIDGDMNEQQMGLHARVLGKGIRKVNAVIGKTATCVIFINQLRQKIGVMFGCFHEDTPVVFADGTQHYIREVYEKKLSGPVLSLNTSTGRIEERNIVNWFKNGSLAGTEYWMTVSLSSVGGISGCMSFTATPNHKVFVMNKGNIEEVSVQNLKPGDKMVSWYEKRIGNNPSLRSMIVGTLLGDGNIRVRDLNTACLRLRNSEQPEYLQWKLQMMEELGFCHYPSKNGKVNAYNSTYTSELCKLKSRFYREGTKYRVVPEKLVLTPLSLAIWYMDDGHYVEGHRKATISIKRLFNNEDKQKQFDILLSQIKKIVGDDSIHVNTCNKHIYIPVSAFAKMSRIIRRFVPDCMQYKLNPEDRGKYNWVGPEKSIVTKEKTVSTVTSVEVASSRKHRSKTKYDLQIEGNSTYFVGGSYRGVAVHNSPEDTPGGKALKFFSSIRLEVKRIGSIKSGEDVIGNRVRITVVKNKLAPPFRRCDTDLIFGQGFVKESELIDMALDAGVMDKRSSWMYYGDNKFAGKQAAVEFFKNTPGVFEEMYHKINELEVKTEPVVDAGPIDDESVEEALNE